jgi:DNA end-binding protein Ku
LRKLVKRKAAGKPIERPEAEERGSNVIDLMEALRQSVKGRSKAAALRGSSPSKKSKSAPALRKARKAS